MRLQSLSLNVFLEDLCPIAFIDDHFYFNSEVTGIRMVFLTLVTNTLFLFALSHCALMTYYFIQGEVTSLLKNAQ